MIRKGKYVMDFILQYLAGWNVAALICLIVGVALLMVEMFTPGFGLFGCMGIVGLIASVILSSDSLLDALVTTVILIVVLGLIAFLVLRSVGHGAFSRSPMVLNEKVDYDSDSHLNEDRDTLLGKSGKSVSPLRPAGSAEICGRRVSVITDGEFIPEGESVTVTEVRGMRVLVRRTSDVCDNMPQNDDGTERA